MKLKLWLRRLSVSAPKMSVKSHLPWPAKVLLSILAIGIGGAMALWIYDLGRSFTGFDPGASREKLAAIQEQVEKIKTERDQFSTTVNSAESQLNIERSAQKQLALQVKTLEGENIKLKEDLAFFESLLPADTGSQGVSIRRLKADVITPNQLRYRLLVMQGGKGDREFTGTLQLVVTVLQGDKSAMMIFPESNSRDTEKFKLGFKHYQRIEGVLTLPAGVLMKSVQAKILDKGQVRAQQSANL
ncbi:hypothetical protein BH11PSE11_BH11PSE11_32760 [soil metagenome]